MVTLKSVCSTWSGLISRDKYEHTHLRLWIYSYQVGAELPTFRIKGVFFKKCLHIL